MEQTPNPKVYLDAFRSESKEGETFVTDDGEMFVFNGAEWVRSTPTTLEVAPLKEEVTIDFKSAGSQYATWYHTSPSLQLTCSPSPYLTIYNDTDVLVEIDVTDGTVSFGKNYDPEEAARIFWESVASLSPWAVPSAPTVTEEEYKAELELQNQHAMMQAAEDQMIEDAIDGNRNGDLDYFGTPWPEDFNEYVRSMDDSYGDVDQPERDPFEAGRGVIE